MLPSLSNQNETADLIREDIAPTVWPPEPTNVTPFNEPAPNTSGTDGPIPIEVSRIKFHWGAFGLNFLWLAAHKGAYNGFRFFLLLALPVLSARKYWPNGNFVLLLPHAYCIYFGLKGAKVAWESRKFESVDQFLLVQQVWSNWFFVVFGLVAISAVLLVLSYGMQNGDWFIWFRVRPR